MNSRRVGGSEREHASAFQDWLAVAWPTLGDPFICFHIPNGGDRPLRAGAQLKREGTLSGVPDYLVPIPRGAFASLYIELKAPDGRLNPNQKRVIDQLRRCGNRVVVAYGWEQARDAVMEYMNFGRAAA